MRLPNPLCVGIDVSKATLDIAATAEIEQFTTSNDSDGFDENSKSVVSLLCLWRLLVALKQQ
ncbi:transposase [Escherichia coli]|nr:transposase [Escherichia coli]